GAIPQKAAYLRDCHFSRLVAHLNVDLRFPAGPVPVHERVHSVTERFADVTRCVPALPVAVVKNWHSFAFSVERVSEKVGRRPDHAQTKRHALPRQTLPSKAQVPPRRSAIGSTARISKPPITVRGRAPAGRFGSTWWPQ